MGEILSSPSRVVGVLGGMGPAATVDFYNKLVKNTPAVADQDHLRVIIWADPTVPSRQDAILRGGQDPTPWLERGIAALRQSGAELIVVPCNTVHVYLDNMVPPIPGFISIVDVTLEAVRLQAPAGAVGLLATDAALEAGLFQSALRNDGLEFTVPDEQRQSELMELVNAVKAGEAGMAESSRLGAIMEAMLASGATSFLAGCTELSTLLDGLEVPGDCVVIDPAVELARTVIRRAREPLGGVVGCA
jgi:aspartate racemase